MIRRKGAQTRGEKADAGRVATWRAGFFSPESSAAGFAGAAAAAAEAAAGDVEVMMEEEREGLAPESFMTMAKPGGLQRRRLLCAGVVVIAVSSTVG